jgi:glycine cleavage system H protein
LGSLRAQLIREVSKNGGSDQSLDLRHRSAGAIRRAVTISCQSLPFHRSFNRVRHLPRAYDARRELSRKSIPQQGRFQPICQILPMMSLDVPDDREYTSSHEWVRIDGESAIVGITAWHPQIAGKILRVELPEISFTAKTGDIVATICSANEERKVSAPISGTVLEVNGSLQENPELLVSDPYAEGWLLRLRIEAGEELEHLLAANHYREQMRVEDSLDAEST